MRIGNKIIVLTGIVLFALNAKAEEGKPSYGTVEVISEKENDSITDGYTLIVGKVKSKHYVPESFVVGIQDENNPRVNVLTVTPDNNGKFTLRFKASEKILYCQSSLNNEIVLPNRAYKNKFVTKVEFTSTEQPALIPAKFPPGVKKPVVYLYSDDDLNVDLKLDFKGEMTFTYPIYKEGWSAQVTKDEMLVDGKPYPYLFWEGTKKDLNFKQVDGKIAANRITKSDVVSYLETNLSKLGLNPTEQADFITFWAPLITKHDEVYVQFLIDEEYEESIAEMQVTPQPNQSRRIYMLYTDARDMQSFNVVQQEIETIPLDRSGFVLVEWGGSELVFKNAVSQIEN